MEIMKTIKKDLQKRNNGFYFQRINLFINNDYKKFIPWKWHGIHLNLVFCHKLTAFKFIGHYFLF